MTLTSAREAIGRAVVYRPPQTTGGYPAQAGQEGVITSVDERFVYVRYGTDGHSKGTWPANLLLAEET